MKLRRQRGATLGLVAACVFLVILVGVGFFFLSKIIGGGREVANATDAGVLNVAKQAVRRGAVPLSGGLIAEFGELTEPKDSKVDLVTYNRLVAQALIVGKNAESLGGAAVGHANSLRADVRTIGLALKNNLAAETNFANDFSSIASQNNTKMWDGPAVSLVGSVASGYMKTGSSTNVYFSQNTLDALRGSGPAWTPAVSTQKSKADPSAFYLAGYTPISVNGNASFLYGVPVLPQTKPHLVDHGQFVTTAVDSDTPPNAFRTNSRALEGKSGAMGTSVACAIVGVINKEFAAVIPIGFIRVKNGNDAESQNGPLAVPVSDGKNDIFNNELFSPPGPGVFAANVGPSGAGSNGGVPVFSQNSGSLNQARSDWSAYAATLGNFPNGSTYTDTTVTPNDPTAINNITANPGLNYGGGDPNIWVSKNLASYLQPGTLNGSSTHDIRATDGAAPHGLYANFNELIALGKAGGSNEQCTHTMYDETLASGNPKYNACAVNLANWMDNYGRVPTFSNSTQPGGFTNVEYMKADLLGQIAGRKGGKFCASVGYVGQNPANGAFPASGLKAWPGGVKSGQSGSAVAFPAGNSKINYMQPGTPLTLLNQLGSGGSANCNAGPIIDQITDRMRQVDATVQKVDVESALNSLPLTLNGAPTGAGGSLLYLSVDPGTHQPRLTTTAPYTDSNIAPDGPAPSGGNKCDSKYPLDGWAVNTSKVNAGGSSGDGGYHEVPFTALKAGDPSPNGTDSALWQPASGYNNLLGELRFQQTVEGATFCKPN